VNDEKTGFDVLGPFHSQQTGVYQDSVHTGQCSDMSRTMFGQSSDSVRTCPVQCSDLIRTCPVQHVFESGVFTCDRSRNRALELPTPTSSRRVCTCTPHAPLSNATLPHAPRLSGPIAIWAVSVPFNRKKNGCRAHTVFSLTTPRGKRLR